MVGEGEGRCIAIDTYGTYNDGQPGREAGVVCQIFRRCHEPSKSQPPAIMSAFARSSISGYVFIEAYNVGEVRHAVDGFVTVRRDMQPHFIAPTEYVGLLSRDTLSSSQVKVGQWVRCISKPPRSLPY